MARAAAKITMAEIERVLKAARRADFVPARFEIEGGKIAVFSGDAALECSMTPLQKWRRDNGKG